MDSTPTSSIIPLHDVVFGELMRDEEDGAIDAMNNLLSITHTQPAVSQIDRAKAVVTHHVENADKKDRPPIYLAFARKVGNECYGQGLYKEAITSYKDAIKLMASEREDLLTSNFFNPTYIFAFNGFFEKKAIICMDFMACCNNIAQCYLKQNDLPSALEWLQEVDVVWECYRLKVIQREGPDAFSKVLEHCTYRMKAAARLIHIFSSLGNTAAVTHFSYLSSVHYPARFPESIPQIKRLIDECDAEKWFEPLHPTLKAISKRDVTEGDLQVRGIWRKLYMNSKLSPSRRKYDGCWIWKNRLYIFGGVCEDSHTVKRDLWYWDMNVQRWTRLPDVPEEWMQFVIYCQTPIVYNDVAIFFSGFATVLMFWLVPEKWNFVETKIHGDSNWPYSTQLFNASITAYKSFVFVFGGNTSSGSNNILMVLELESFHWLVLGEGYDGTYKQYTDWPRSRESAACWIDPDKDQFYILYGVTQASDGRVNEAPDDFWSYSIKDSAWTRERIRGNAPTPRHLMSTVYHPNTNSVIIYGGMGSINTTSYSPLPPRGSDNYKYAVYGDAFIMDVSTNTWKQIVTRNFPAWRSEGHLLVDHATGNIYLTGGSLMRKPFYEIICIGNLDHTGYAIFVGTPEKIFFDAKALVEESIYSVQETANGQHGKNTKMFTVVKRLSKSRGFFEEA